MILNQPDFFARSATLDGAISDTDTQITLSGLSTRFTDAVSADTLRYPLGPFRISDDDGFELIAITGHVSGTTFEVERGIQGTDALAWAGGTAVRAVVTRGQLMDRHLIQSQLVTASGQIVAYDDFDRSDRSLDGDTMPSGQQWLGDYSISDRRVERNSGVAVFPFQKDRAFTLQVVVLQRSDGGSIGDANRGGVVTHWVDSDNYLAVYMERNRCILSKVVNGVETELESQGVLSSNNNWIDAPYTLKVSLVSRVDLTFICEAFSESYDFSTSDAEALTIMNNHTHKGMYLTDPSSKIGGFVCYERV